MKEWRSLQPAWESNKLPWCLHTDLAWAHTCKVGFTVRWLASPSPRELGGEVGREDARIRPTSHTSHTFGLTLCGRSESTGRLQSSLMTLSSVQEPPLNDLLPSQAPAMAVAQSRSSLWRQSPPAVYPSWAFLFNSPSPRRQPLHPYMDQSLLPNCPRQLVLIADYEAGAAL